MRKITARASAAIAVVAAIFALTSSPVGTRAARDEEPAARGTFLGTARVDRLDAVAVHASELEGDVQIEPPPEEFDGPAPAQRALPPRLRNLDGVVPSGGVWAAVVGINDYPGTRSDLRSAVNDATDVDEALDRFGVPAEHRLVLTDADASRPAILAAADWLVAHASSDATAVFFYAGHARRVSSSTQSIVGSDGATIRDVELRDRLAPLRAKQTWIGMAACYGGGFDELVAPGRILTAAAGRDQLAYENASFGRSYMVEYMVRQAMIERAAPGSVQTAFDYAASSLARDYPQRAPVAIDHAGGPVELGRLSAAAGPAPPPKQPSSQPRSGGAPPDNAGDKPKDPDDGCSALTLGVVRCGSSR